MIKFFKREEYEDRRIIYCYSCHHKYLCGLDPVQNDIKCPCAECILKTNCTKKCGLRTAYILEYDF